MPPEINSPEVDISGALSKLDSDLFDTPKIGADHCSAAQSGAPGTLIESGRGGLPNSDLQMPTSLQQILNEPEAKDATVYFTERKLPYSVHLAENSRAGCRKTGI